MGKVMKIATKSKQETQLLGKKIARGIVVAIAGARSPKAGARVIALHGNLGAGKTTFVQGLAKGFGIAASPKSPTFIILQIFPVRTKGRSGWALAHLDAWRIKKARELELLGIRKLFRDPKAIVVIEWPEKIKNILPKDTVWIHFRHKGKNKREIVFGHNFKFNLKLKNTSLKL